LFVSIAGLMQVPPQHSQPGGQARPQPPQLAPEDRKFVHLPLQQFGNADVQQDPVNVS